MVRVAAALLVAQQGALALTVQYCSSLNTGADLDPGIIWDLLIAAALILWL